MNLEESMNDTTIAYTDTLVKNLIAIAELNAQLQEYIERLDKADHTIIDLENTIKTEMLFHYAHCLHIHVQYKEAKKYAMGMNSLPEDEKEHTLLNLRNMLDYINVSYQSERLHITLLYHLNKLFLYEIKDVWDTSKLIFSDKDIETTYEYFSSKDTVLHAQVNDYVHALEEYDTNNSASDIIKATLLSYELVSHRIFASGNDAVALGSCMLLFKKAGLNKYTNCFKCFYTLMHHADTGSTIMDRDVFIEAFVNELANNLKDIKGKLSPFIDDMHTENSKYADLNLRQIKGLVYIKQKGRVSREIYAKLNNVSQITSYRDLSNLLQKGYVRVEGIGKGTKYML